VNIMELNDNQFLKIRKIGSVLDFEIYEIPQEKRRRPNRWHIQIPIMEITNRHTKKSKLKKLNDTIFFLRFATKNHFASLLKPEPSSHYAQSMN
jgi:hypothetical protein